MPSPAEIASVLNALNKKVLASLVHRPQYMVCPAALLRHELVTVEWQGAHGDVYHITDLGRAVAAELEANDG